MSLAPKLDHKLRYILEQLTEPQVWKFNGQETAVTRGTYILDTFPIVCRHDKAALRPLPHQKHSPRLLTTPSPSSTPTPMSTV